MPFCLYVSFLFVLSFGFIPCQDQDLQMHTHETNALITLPHYFSMGNACQPSPKLFHFMGPESYNAVKYL